MCQLPCGTIAQHVGTWANFLFRFAFRDNQQFVTGMQLQRAIGDHEFVPPFYQHHQHTFRQIHIHQPVSLCQHFLRQYDIAEVCMISSGISTPKSFPVFSSGVSRWSNLAIHEMVVP